MPQPIVQPVSPRADESAADLDALARLGIVKPGPAPSQAPPRDPPHTPPPEPTPAEQANEAALQDALVAAGVEKAPEDEAVIDALARLDPSTVTAVARWLKSKKKDSSGR